MSTYFILSLWYKGITKILRHVPHDGHRELWGEFMLGPAKDGHLLVTHTRKIYWYIFLHSRNQTGRIM